MNKTISENEFEYQIDQCKSEMFETVKRGGEVRVSGGKDGWLKVQLIPKVITSKHTRPKI